jgi:hypothetical protein
MDKANGVYRMKQPADHRRRRHLRGASGDLDRRGTVDIVTGAIELRLKGRLCLP